MYGVHHQMHSRPANPDLVLSIFSISYHHCLLSSFRGFDCIGTGSKICLFQIAFEGMHIGFFLAKICIYECNILRVIYTNCLVDFFASLRSIDFSIKLGFLSFEFHCTC